MKDTIRTLHPDKKQGVNISREKYEVIHKAIMATLRQNKEMPFMKLARAVEKEMHGKFDGSVTWYVTTANWTWKRVERSSAFPTQDPNSSNSLNDLLNRPANWPDAQSFIS